MPCLWVIAGPPFSGKSTVGPLLAEILGWPFLDLDKIVESRAGASVEDIFRLRGRKAFRNLETQCLMELLGEPGPMVAALGGGTLLSRKNLRAVMKRAVIFTLDPGEEELRARLTPDRPLSRNPEELEKLLGERLEHYRSLPGRVDTRGLSPSETARLIAARIAPLRRIR
mgnify:CR=1 FL=1